MPAPWTLLPAAYLIGAIPFGYLIGRFRGVDLFQAGSGNIGATNAGRVLGWRFGILVFLLDFLKGALPVAAMAAVNASQAQTVLAAALAFLGHLFPIYLGFRGGKGVATGCGTVFVLAPGPAAFAVLAWITIALASRFVSLASLAAVGVLVAFWLASTPAPFVRNLPITIYLLAGLAMLLAKHRANIRRLIAGTENQLGDFTLRTTLLRVLHLMALGIWFGGAGFFNFVSAPLIFQSFESVVKGGPSDRTAQVEIAKGLSAEEQEQLGKALAGSAVGPIFPPYRTMQIVCCAIALVTALAWRKQPGLVHRLRVKVLAVGLILVVIALPLGHRVSELRVQRFDASPAVREKAKADFAAWHLASLFLSMATTTLAGIALAMAARLPEQSA